MFSRLILHDRDALVGLLAFAVALLIFLLMTWRALRMPRAQREEMASLPFRDDTPPRHDTDHTAA